MVYVDDFVLAGKEEWHQRFWDDLSKVVQIDDVGDLGRFLGRHHSTVRVEGKELLLLTCEHTHRTLSPIT